MRPRPWMVCGEKCAREEILRAPTLAPPPAMGGGDKRSRVGPRPLPEQKFRYIGGLFATFAPCYVFLLEGGGECLFHHGRVFFAMFPPHGVGAFFTMWGLLLHFSPREGGLFSPWEGFFATFFPIMEGLFHCVWVFFATFFPFFWGGGLSQHEGFFGYFFLYVGNFFSYYRGSFLVPPSLQKYLRAAMAPPAGAHALPTASAYTPPYGRQCICILHVYFTINIRLVTF